MNVDIYVPDQLWHKWRRAYPSADLGMVVRAMMADELALLATQQANKRALDRKMTALRSQYDQAVRLIGRRGEASG